MVDAALTARAAADRRNPGAPRLPRLDHAHLKDGPGAGLLILGLFLVVLGPCVALVDVVSGLDYDGIALIVGIGLTGLGALAFVLRGSLDAAHSRRIEGIPGPVRGQQIPAARERHPRVWLFAAGVVLQLGLGVFYLGVLLRQPCRDCDQRSYGDSWIEDAIDLFVGLGAVAIALPLLLLVATSLPAVIGSLRSEHETRRRAQNGTLTWTHDAAAQLKSTGTWLAVAQVVAVVGFVVLGAGLIPILGSDSVMDDEERAILTPFTNAIVPGIALIVVGVAVAIFAQFESASRRAAIHRALPGHDVRAKAKDSGDA
ncbi:hypothetical protein [Microbacterium karelineae]|uniref:hypothetical protein n=1 Tax=Microbacterium karelineae TaxID=2654283 RepID=UPI0012E9FC36|nr:hypothetical protein [Microbacterium karelineae]